MSTVIANTQIRKVARFYESTIGKKAIMAVTGLMLFGFLIAHMLGNLQIFLGSAVMNHYAETLHGNPAAVVDCTDRAAGFGDPAHLGFDFSWPCSKERHGRSPM